MVGRRPASPTQLPTIGNTSFHLGVIVDTTTYGSEDELSLSNDVPSVIEEEGSLSDGGGVVRIMRNGKVKRKLRWKPPNFRRKKNNVSSNMSVVSSLTNRSTGTNRSTSTSRSFLSHFSRKSQSSFHTFHSTATPVANNKKNSPQPHVLQRPNYPDTFDAKHATIDNEGRHVLKKMGSGNLLGTVNEVAVFERSSTLPSRLDGMAMSPRSPMTEASTVQFFDPYGGTSASIASDPFDSLEPDKPEPIVKPEKPKRPPLFRLRKAKERPPSPEEASKDSSTNNSSTSPVGATYTAPTISSSGSPLSPQSLEGENSVLPVLETETYEEDRRVALTIGTPPRSQQDYSDHTGDNAPRGSAPLSPKSHHSSPSSTPSRSVVKITDKIEKSPTGPTIQKPSTTPDSLRPPLPVTASVGRQTPSPSCRASPHKRYNRPVDSMSAPPQSVLMTSGEDGTEAQQAEPQRRQRPNTTVPVDVDAGAFLEAEHNLKAIHDMAAEHLAHGEYEEATEVFEEILRGQQERYGQNHYRVGTALHNLGIVHLKAGDFERAIDVCGQAVEVRKESLAPNHPDAAVSLAQLGVAYLESQNYDQALVAFREALHIRRNFLGPRHLKCSKILNNIGCAQYSLDELEEARQTFEEALDIQRETLRLVPSTEDGQDSISADSNSILLSMASTLCNVGSIRLRRGQFDEADVALEEALLIQQSVLGDDHPMVVSTMENMEFVENSKYSAIPSSSDLLARWTHPYEESDRNEKTLMCTQEPSIDEVLNLNVFTSFSSPQWFKRMENAITDGTCAPNFGTDEVPAANDTTSTSDVHISSRFSV